jgi:hypothetical protein
VVGITYTFITMKRKELKALGLPTGNQKEVTDKTLLCIYENNTVFYDDLFSLVFENATGKPLEILFDRALIQLTDKEFITKSVIPHAMGMSEGHIYFTVTAKGISACNPPWGVYKQKPYTYGRWVLFAEMLFTKYLPIFISLAALIISYWVYKLKQQD